jgi:hypothetical protein
MAVAGPARRRGRSHDSLSFFLVSLPRVSFDPSAFFFISIYSGTMLIRFDRAAYVLCACLSGHFYHAFLYGLVVAMWSGRAVVLDRSRVLFQTV